MAAQLQPSQALATEDGRQFVLVDRLGVGDVPPAEKARNIYMLASDGSVCWQVQTDFDQDGDPFTSIFWEATALRAYRWDGGVYEIDQLTGKAEPKYLAK